jgi:hypothetical protein
MPLANRRGPYPAYVEWVGTDSATIVLGAGRGMPFAIDRDGRLLGEVISDGFVFRRSP